VDSLAARPTIVIILRFSSDEDLMTPGMRGYPEYILVITRRIARASMNPYGWMGRALHSLPAKCREKRGNRAFRFHVNVDFGGALDDREISNA